MQKNNLLQLLSSPFHNIRLSWFFLAVFIGVCRQPVAQTRILDSNTHLLRSGDQAEWQEFANMNSQKQFSLTFNVDNKIEQTLSFVQYDVKQNWNVVVNDQKIGVLVTDGNKMRTYYKIPREVLNSGSNKLTIQAATTIPDDVVISEIILHDLSIEKILSQSTVDIEILETTLNKPVPSRLTIVDRKKILQTTGTHPATHLAIRPGFIYTGNGAVSVLLPAGDYVVYAGRGFEYGVDSFPLSIKPGERVKKRMMIKREVETRGWVSSDTHIHTLTHSGHGDATDLERTITIAGEGIELPVITEHNKIRNFESESRQTKTDSFFTIVAGDEVTTAVGHFNVFPFEKNTAVPDHRVTDWNDLSQKLPGDSQTIIVLNHGRDIHNDFRPFDPKRHVAVAGHRLDLWKLPANAMETVNSGALQENPMRLFYDWFGLLNRGMELTPVGASDSHDVSRYLIGQARTYIKTNDSNPDKINIPEALENLRKGNVMVSFGLLPKILVNAKSGPGDLAVFSKSVTVDVEVLGPSWIKAEKVSLYVNGIKFREVKIRNENVAGVKWKGKWNLPRLQQDVFLAVIAEGNGDHLPFWPIVKPFQPISTAWKPYTIGASGAVRVDGDNDGRFTSAYEYAKKLTIAAGMDFKALFKALSVYDESVAVQVAAILHEYGTDLFSPEFTKLLAGAAIQTSVGFRKFTEALVESRK